MEPTQGKICKELRTISRFLQRNQNQRFSDAAQKKLVDCVGHYVGLSKQGSAMVPRVAEPTLQTVKDGLAMPFNVVGTKQKKRLLKWYNELIAMVGGNSDVTITGDILTGDIITGEPSIEWSAMAIDEDGFLSLMQVETGASNESFQIKKGSTEYKRIKKALDNNEVTVTTSGNEIKEIRVEDE